MKVVFFSNIKHPGFTGIVFQIIQMGDIGTQIQSIYDGVNKNFSIVC